MQKKYTCNGLPATSKGPNWNIIGTSLEGNLDKPTFGRRRKWWGDGSSQMEKLNFSAGSTVSNNVRILKFIYLFWR
jgi:hypothetical protein